MQRYNRNDKACFLPGERVEVLLPRPFDHGFDYLVPEGMQLSAGSYVSVPFGSREMIGVVWGTGSQEVPDSKCKPIAAHHALWPAMPYSLRQLIDWTADYTLSPKGMVLKMAVSLPDAIIKPPETNLYCLHNAEAGKRSAERDKVIEALTQSDGQTLAQLKAASGVSQAVIQGMVKAGFLEKAVRHCVAARPDFTAQNHPTLHPQQQVASDTIKSQLQKGFQVFALEGVTGSGKTEVYFDVIEAILARNEGQILVLLPEIALTSQWMERFEARFGHLASLWHSSVPLSKRKRIWQSVASGTAPLVVGARSALFLPYRDLRMIIVDEEHEVTYKQEEGVLYHARDMAVARAKHEAIPILLCSATLSLETKANSEQGKYQHLELTERYGDYAEPIPSLIDLRQDKPDSGNFISPTLRQAMLEALEAGHQSMLFLNRRGYAPLLLCRGCGFRFQCGNCSAWMVRHSRPDRLQCHHCDWRQTVPKACPECSSEDLVACGPGVERIAVEVAAFMPDARLALLSSDEGELSGQIEAILNGTIDIIIGTQMVAKGHHFPKLALVGVVDADIGLDGGDLRAGERTYQLLHQLAGRAGRESAEGRVLLQTTQPDHPLMQALAAGDRVGFMAQETEIRKSGGWPPYGRLAGILLEGFDEEQVKAAAMQLIRCAPRYEDVIYLGPAPAPIARARNRYRYRILIKAPKQVALQQLIREWVQRQKLPSVVKLKVDIDPYSFM